MIRKKLTCYLSIFILMLLASCSNQDTASGMNVATYIPEAPNYSDSTLWYIRKNTTVARGADVFYLVSTWEADWTTADGRLCHYADVYNAGQRADMDKEISRIADYMGEVGDFYSPYYRHITIDIWATQNEDTISSYYRTAFSDVQDAFNTFLKNRPDPERPFVLAGFSQGAKSVVELLKTMPADVARHLVAAYVLGYKVTPADTLATKNIRAAQGATDTGVTICYNSVSDVSCIKPVVAAPCVMCINPVNWRTDATPATLHDTITVSVSPEHHVLVVKGYSGSEYHPIRGFLNVGDFHSAEPWLYQECLRQNIRERVEAYYQKTE